MPLYEWKHIMDAEYFVVEKKTDFSYPLHIHYCFEIILITEGDMEVTVDGRVHSLTAGDAALIFPNQIHALHTPVHSCHILCVFSPDLVGRYAQAVGQNIPFDNKLLLKGDPILSLFQGMTTEDNLYRVKGILYYLCGAFMDQAVFVKRTPKQAEKQALLYGSWDSFSGQVFTEWRNDPNHYEDQRWTHVIAPFTIPKHWKIYRGYDFGFSKPFSVGWYAADEEGRLYRIKELYGCTGRPNEGLRIDPVEQARRIREAEQNDPVLRGRVIQGIADPAIFDESRGESIAAMMERGPNFLHWMPGDHTRLAGKMQMHYRLNFDGEGRPMLQVFNTCKHFIRTIPNLVYDESNVEDIDTRQEDHIYDECRYVLMENPISPPRHTSAPPVLDDPLELHRKAKFLRV